MLKYLIIFIFWFHKSHNRKLHKTVKYYNVIRNFIFYITRKKNHFNMFEMFSAFFFLFPPADPLHFTLSPCSLLQCIHRLRRIKSNNKSIWKCDSIQCRYKGLWAWGLASAGAGWFLTLPHRGGLWVSLHPYSLKRPPRLFQQNTCFGLKGRFSSVPRHTACREPVPVVLQALPCCQRWVFLMESCRTLGPVGSAALSMTQKTQHREKDPEQQSGHFACI